MIVGEIGAAPGERSEMRRIGFTDRIRTHAVPDEYDDATR